MDIVKLVAQQRQQTGKGVCRRLRRAGQLPAVIYGNGATVSIALQEKDVALLHKSSANENTILELAIEGDSVETCHAIVREVHVDPASRALLHADLYRVDMSKPITVSVALTFINEPLARLQGANASLTHVCREVQVACLPQDIPEHIVADLADVQLGTPFKAASLTLPAGVTLVTDADEVIATAHVDAPAGAGAGSEGQ
ncbi:MAG: 50S ribosomal protein L25 [Candidatus Tectimicrobiota bacterium]